MKTYPLKSMDLQTAMEKQFKLIDCITRNFRGSESLTRGDLGVHQPENQPLTTRKAENAIADFFNCDEAILVRGSGTGAIRYGLAAVCKPKDKILIHKAPVYSTTKTSLEMFGIDTVEADFNDINEIKKVLENNFDISAALIQHSRQTLDDSYQLEDVIKTIKQIRNIPIVVDDNYAIMKTECCGVEYGADLSCFSTFKLQGPEGIGCVIGKKEYIDNIRKMHYSGGCQVQGWESLEVLRGLTYAPVMLAITAQEIEKAAKKLNSGEIKEIKSAVIANAQSKVLLVEFKEPIAKKVLVEAEKLGALPNPVGSESKYELVPLFYRVSGTMLKKDPKAIDYMIRVNCNRASSNTVLRILKESIKNCEE